jgi:hypothetical protein
LAFLARAGLAVWRSWPARSGQAGLLGGAAEVRISGSPPSERLRSARPFVSLQRGVVPRPRDQPSFPQDHGLRALGRSACQPRLPPRKVTNRQKNAGWAAALWTPDPQRRATCRRPRPIHRGFRLCPPQAGIGKPELSPTARAPAAPGCPIASRRPRVGVGPAQL